VFLIDRAKKLEQLKQKISALKVTYKLNRVSLDQLQYFPNIGGFTDHDTGKSILLADNDAAGDQPAPATSSDSSSGDDVEMDEDTDVDPELVKPLPEYARNSDLEKTFADLFKQDPVKSRSYRPVVSSETKDGTSYWFLGAAQGSDWRSLFYMDQQCCTKAVATEICKDLTNFLNSFPGFVDGAALKKYAGSFSIPVYQKSGHSMMYRLAQLSAAKRVPESNTCIPQPTLKLGPGGKDAKWVVRPVLVDPATNGLFVKPPVFSISTHTAYDTTKDFSVFIPQDARFQKDTVDHESTDLSRMKQVYTITSTTAGFQHESSIPDDLNKSEHLREELGRLENLARGLQAAVHLKKMTRQQFEEFASKWIEHRAMPPKSSISPTKRSSSPRKRSVSPIKQSNYQRKHPDSPLKANFENQHAPIVTWTIDKAKRQCVILPNESLKASVDGRIPALNIGSLDKSRALIVAEVMSDTWCSTGSIIDTWIAGAEEADRANLNILEGVPPLSQCMCTSIADKSTRHLCPGCGHSILCSKLQQGMFGLRYCHHCVEKPSQKAKHLKAQLQQRLSSCMEPVAKGSLNVVLNFILASTKALAPEADQWHDTYTSQTQQLSHDHAVRAGDISIDAVMPIGRTSEGSVGLHCPGNVVLTNRCLNFSKHVHLVALLQGISTFVNDTEMIQNGNLKNSSKQALIRVLQRNLMSFCDELSAVRSLVPYTRDGRLDMEISTAEIDELLQMFKSAKLPTNVNSPLPRRYLENDISRNTWPSNELARIKAIIREIEKEFRVELPRSDDKCPYFGLPDTMPDDWSWRRAFGVVVARLFRMKQQCNGYWITIETPLTIFVEIIFIVCVRECTMNEDEDGVIYTAHERMQLRRKYCEFLHLPITVYALHPLCFALTHDKHGQRMATGFTHDATSLRDRDETRNNLLVETRTSNYTKWEFHEDDYPGIKDTVRNINIPTDYYERDAPRVTLPDGLWQKLQPLANKAGKSPVDLPSVFEDGVDFEMEDMAADNEDDEILFRATDDPVGHTNPLQARYNTIHELFNTRIPANMDKAAAVMSDMTEALRNEDVKKFDKCEELVRAQFEDDELLHAQSEDDDA
jgi:hypothetical protein